MRYLYSLLLFSLGVLLWAAWSIARHIRKHAASDGTQPIVEKPGVALEGSLLPTERTEESTNE